MPLFAKAVKTQAKLRLAIMGPSGSGKTYTSLAVASALTSKRIALVDTEHGSAAKYADLADFDIAVMHPPYHPDKYIAAIAEAAAADYGVIILDSLSHAWAGPGGVLDLVNAATSRSKSQNSYLSWREGTPIHQRLIEAILSADLHVIATMRTKTEYVLETDDHGKQVPRKVGMAPIQRDQVDYEFDVVLELNADNVGVVIKSRCPSLTNAVIPRPGAGLAAALDDWLQGAPPPDPQGGAAQPAPQEAPETHQERPAPRSAAPKGQTKAAPPPAAQNGAKAKAKPADASPAELFASWCLERHKGSAEPCSPDQYGYLVGVIDAMCEAKAHRAVLKHLCGAEITSENRPGIDVASGLLRWLPETKGPEGARVPNPDYRPNYAVIVQQLWRELSGQLALDIPA